MAPKSKDKPKPLQPAIAIENLLTTLNQHIQRSEHDQAAKVADQVLSMAPNDEDAIRCKVVALIKDNRIDEALSTRESSRGLDFSFFKAYCLYIQNKLNEALELLEGHYRNSATMVLQSQILFCMGKMDASLDIYQKIQKSKIESLEINLVAGLVSSGRSSEVQRVMEALRVRATSSFKLAYNTACALIENNKYSDAEQLLLSAQRIGQETLMVENWADDDIEIKLAPITVQLAYVQQLLGHTQEAIEAYTDIIKRNLADESSLAVATNNLVALKGPKDISDSLRKLDQLLEKGSRPQSFQLAREPELYLSPKQKETIYTNRVLLLLHSNKIDQAREFVAALLDIFPDGVIPVLLQAAVSVRENKARRAEKILAQFSEKFPDKSKIVLLARAQVAAAAGHPQVAADSLAKILEIQHMPATVATLVCLKKQAGDIEGAVVVFDSAIEWWSNAMAEDNKLNLLMQEAASFKLKHGRKDEAAQLYKELVKSHESTEVLVGLIKTAAHADIDEAEAYEKKLKPLPGLKAVDVDSLEKTSGAKHVENGNHVRIAEPFKAKGKEKVKKKRNRKPRYPKGFDHTNPGPAPDLERWLPKRERSSYRPKRKDKRTAQLRGTQGAVVKEVANSNAKSNQTTNSKATSQDAVAEQPKPFSKSWRKKSRN